MNKRWRMMICMGLLAILLLAGCSKGNNSGDTEGSGVKILMCISDGSDTFRATLAEAAEKTAKEIGAKVDVVDAKNSIETQVEQISQAESKGYHAILCCPVDPDTAVQMEASAGELPIIFMNSCPEEKRLEADKYMFVGSDELVAGRYQAEYVLDQLGNKNEINVVLLKGERSHSGTKGRTEAVKNTFADSGKQINFVFDDYADWSTEYAAEMFETFLELESKYDCVICNNDSMALGVIEVCKEKGIDLSEIPVLGVDATVDGCKAIQEGDMAFTVYQSATGQGEAGVKVAAALANGDKASESGLEVSEDGKYVWVPFEKVDQSNVSSYQ
ncbi:MAG: substrate-binding domain-containing protein [Lachnospiraceae bacterium]|nr:substrate-binding domain-containing protein [Lachnospiraceae bacterium]